MADFEDIQKMINSIEPIVLTNYVIDEHGIFDEEFEKNLKNDIKQIDKEQAYYDKQQDIYDEILNDIKLIDQKKRDDEAKGKQELLTFIKNLPNYIPVNKIAKVSYTVYSYEYIDNLVEYDNILKMYYKECTVNSLNMSEYARRNYQKRIDEYLETFKIKKQFIIFEKPINICVEVNLTNNEICMYSCNSIDAHKLIMSKIFYIDFDIKYYSLDMNITYGILYNVYYKKFININFIEQILRYFSNPISSEYYKHKVFTRLEIYYLIYNFHSIINAIKKQNIMHKLNIN